MGNSIIGYGEVGCKSNVVYLYKNQLPAETHQMDQHRVHEEGTNCGICREGGCRPQVLFLEEVFYSVGYLESHIGK